MIFVVYLDRFDFVFPHIGSSGEILSSEIDETLEKSNIGWCTSIVARVVLGIHYHNISFK